MKQVLIKNLEKKAVFVLLFFISFVSFSSVCSAYAGCIPETPILTVIDTNSGGMGNFNYSAIANGNGFATYEVRSARLGVVSSGGFRSGQTVSGSIPSIGIGDTITFDIRDAWGNILPSCNADVIVNLNYWQPSCTDAGTMLVNVGTKWWSKTRVRWDYHCSIGLPFTYTLRQSPSFLHAIRGIGLLMSSGTLVSGQVLYVNYREALFSGGRQIFISTFYPGGAIGQSHGHGWFVNPPACNPAFMVIPPAEGLITGKDIQLNAASARIDIPIPANYRWTVDGMDPYAEGTDKAVVYANFLTAGPHTVSLTINSEIGMSCSSSQTFNVASPPAPPVCTAAFTAPASAYYDQNVVFDPTSSSNSGESDIVYKWSIDSTLSAISSFAMPILNRSFDSSNGPDVDIKLDVEHRNGSRCSFTRRVNLSTVPPPPPLPCTVDFSVRNSTKSCLTGSCNFNEPITFAVSASSGPIISYTWTMAKTSGVPETFNGGINTGPSVTKTFISADGKRHNIHLAARDSNGNTCTMDKTINLKPSMPGWTEIAPYLMQLSPLGLLVMVFLARMVFLRL